jgi:hypothetical protein
MTDIGSFVAFDPTASTTSSFCNPFAGYSNYAPFAGVDSYLQTPRKYSSASGETGNDSTRVWSPATSTDEPVSPKDTNEASPLKVDELQQFTRFYEDEDTQPRDLFKVEELQSLAVGSDLDALLQDFSNFQDPRLTDYIYEEVLADHSISDYAKLNREDPNWYFKDSPKQMVNKPTVDDTRLVPLNQSTPRTSQANPSNIGSRQYLASATRAASSRRHPSTDTSPTATSAVVETQTEQRPLFGAASDPSTNAVYHGLKYVAADQAMRTSEPAITTTASAVPGSTWYQGRPIVPSGHYDMPVASPVAMPLSAPAWQTTFPTPVSGPNTASSSSTQAMSMSPMSTTTTHYSPMHEVYIRFVSLPFVAAADLTVCTLYSSTAISLSAHAL